MTLYGLINQFLFRPELFSSSGQIRFLLELKKLAGSGAPLIF
jgi:hypothetical protein